MAIDRGPWNALVDDDGSNLVGTVWNKDKIKTVILDPVDAALLTTGGVSDIRESTAVGTVNDWNISLSGKNTTLLWDGVSNLTVTGIAGGVTGQILTIRNRSGSGVMTFPHYNSNSQVDNRFINMASSAPTSIASNGVVSFVKRGGGVWEMIGHEQGAWITPPFVASDYPGAWSALSAGHVTQARYRLSGKTLQWVVYVSGAPCTATLAQRKFFGGFAGANGSAYHPGTHNFTDSGGPGAGFYQHATAATIDFYKTNAAGLFLAGTLSLNASGVHEVL